MTIDNKSSYSITITSYNASGSSLGSWVISSGRVTTIIVPSNTDYFLITTDYPNNVKWTSSISGNSYVVADDNKIQDSKGSFPDITVSNHGSVCDSSCDSSCYTDCYTDCDSSCYTDCDSSCDNTLFSFPVYLYMQDVNIPYVQSIINNGSININEYVGSNSGILHSVPYNSIVQFQAYPQRGCNFGNWVIRYTNDNSGEFKTDETKTNSSIEINITEEIINKWTKIEIRPVAGGFKQNCWIRVYCNHIGIEKAVVTSPVYDSIDYSANSNSYLGFALYIDESLTINPQLNSSAGYNQIVWDITKIKSDNSKTELKDQTSLLISEEDITDYAYIYIYPKGKKTSPGKVWIYIGTDWVQATPYIYIDNDWVQAIPYIYVQIGTDNSGNPIYDWVQCK